MKKILSLILMLPFAAAIYADDASWKIHPTFDEEVTHVVETPGYVYFTSRQMVANSLNDTYLSLYRYDKKGEELMPLSSSNFLNSNSIRDVIYNAEKGYLMVLYKDFNIDMLNNNGSIINIPYYEQASLSMPKDVNSISIDPNNDRVYLATDFGYVAINDKKGEIAESRLYGEPLVSFSRLGNLYLAVKGTELIKAASDSPRLSLDQYDTVEDLEYPSVLYPLNDNVSIALCGDTGYKKIKKITLNGNEIKIDDLFEGKVHNSEYNSNGLIMSVNNKLYQFKKSDGSLAELTRPEEYSECAAGTDNMSEIWNGKARKGLSSVKTNGEQWSLTRDWMLPDSPAAFASTSYLNHPEKGFMVLDFGYTPQTYRLWSYSPLQLDSYRNGRWSHYAPAYTNPSRTTILTATSGVAMDPDNNQYVYITSYHNGILRLNLNDPNDIIHLAREKDADAGNAGFVTLQPVPATSPGFSNISAPHFDKFGNLWMNYADWDDTAEPNPHFYCWLAADRKATTSASNIKMPQAVEFDAYFPVSNLATSLPLLKTGNGLIVYATGAYDDSLGILDFNGTPLDPSDDKTYPFPYFTDSDGNSLDISYIKYLWEDPSTGYVWVCHDNGVCYFVPSQVTQGNYQLYRVKVARNDGTNLADYLLDGVTVNHVEADSEGRKWFSTAGGGIVCTSSDGREIVEEFNTSNSPLPDDVVYSIGYNPTSNSLMVSTAQGFAEYSLPVSQSSSTKEDIRAYPNPVRPEYSGYVTITDIPTGSFVKIVDSAGNLVKELGIMSGFDILWDLSDSRFNRVKSGVYHIMVSPSDETSSYSTVGKILVIS